MNSIQKQILSNWFPLLVAFLRNEWRVAAIGYSSGVFVGASAALIKSHIDTVTTKLQDANVSAYQNAVTSYAPYAWFILGPIALIFLVITARIAWRAAKSWLLGAAAGSYFWPFVLGVWFFSFSAFSIKRGIISLGIAFFAVFLGFTLRLAGAVRRERTPDIRALGLDKVSRPSSHTTRDPESPIESLQEDRLGRSAFVEMLALKILVSKTPVIAVRGNFGDGKSSVLNMLQQQIGHNAIVVLFNTWLPDSHQTLVADLFDSIAAETRKQFVVPGLRKRLRKIASLIAGGVSFLKALPDVIPPYSQVQEMTYLNNLLDRIPKRVVVLLDEIDRMQKEELLTLLKVVRGVSSLPNLTFVCAFHPEQVERLVCGGYDSDSHEFMEKFFPTGIDVPKPYSDVLKPMLRDQILRSFDKVDWFRDSQERNQFAEGLDRLWDRVLVHVCTNIRKIGLLANDIHAAATLVRKEVDPLDLCALEALQRFYPRGYEVVWTNAWFFSNSAGSWKSRSYRSDDEVAMQKGSIGEALKKLSEESSDNGVIKALLEHMFPERARELFAGRQRSTASDDELLKAEMRKAISHPDYFPIYFGRTVPEAMFSAVEMERFKNRLLRASSDADRRSVFSDTLNLLEPDSLRRYDYVHKVALELDSLPMEEAKSVAFAIASNANKFGNDFLVSESHRALAGVFAVAQRLAASDTINSFLCNCIAVASTDYFASRLYSFMTIKRENNKVVRDFTHVEGSRLQQAFTERMNHRYGPDADITAVELSREDIAAFSLWARVNSVERDKEIAFWERYIGGSRSRLAKVFNLIAPPDTFWTKDSPGFINELISTELLQRLQGELPRDVQLLPADERGIDRLERFLSGELRVGEVLGDREEPRPESGSADRI